MAGAAQFDPDEFMARKQPAPPAEFDPDEFMATTSAPPVKARLYSPTQRGAKMKGTPDTPAILKPIASGVDQAAQGIQEMNEGGKDRAWYNPIPSSKELGGISKLARGAGTVALPYALAANPVGTAVGMAAGIPTAAAVSGGAKALGMPEGTADFAGDVAGAGMGTAAVEGVRSLPGTIRTAVNRIDPVEGLVQGLKPSNQRTGFISSLQRSLPELKATEAELPGKKISSINDLLDAIDLAKKRVWGQYKSITGPQARSYADASPVADAMDASIPDQLKFENPAKAKQLQDEANVYRSRPLTIEELESFLKTTNDELDAHYARNPLERRIAAGRNPNTAGLEAKGNAIRDVLYKGTDAEGEGAAPRELKQRYGSLLEMERAAWPRRNVAARQQPNSLTQQFGKMAGYGQMAKGAIKLLTGNVSGAADIGMGLTEKEMSGFLKEQQTTDNLIRRSFENYQGAPTPVQAAPPVQPKGLLPQGTNAPRGVGGGILTPTPGYEGGPDTSNVRTQTGPPLRAPVSRQIEQGPSIRPSSTSLGGRGGDVQDLVPIKDPNTGEIHYATRPPKVSGPITLAKTLSDSILGGGQ